MKTKVFLLSFFVLLFALPLAAQVKLGDNSKNISPSALFEMENTSKGLLISRMTAAQRGAIISPATGLLVYQTTDPKGFYFYNGTDWTIIAAGTETDPVFVASVAKWITTTDTTKWNEAYTMRADTTSLSIRINLKLAISDTASMLAPYLRKLDTASLSNRIDLKLNKSDTVSMLAPYLRMLDTTSLSNRIDLKLNKSDTTNFVQKVAGKELSDNNFTDIDKTTFQNKLTNCC